jgi:hypothetical protein
MPLPILTGRTLAPRHDFFRSSFLSPAGARLINYHLVSKFSPGRRPKIGCYGYQGAFADHNCSVVLTAAAHNSAREPGLPQRRRE